MTFEDYYDYLLNLCDKLSHETDEQTETIKEQQEKIDNLQNELKYRTNENKALYTDSQQLNKELNGLYKDIEKAKTEINRLKMIIELKDDARVELVKENTTLKNDYKKCYAENIRLYEENNQLKLRNKMLTKIGLNSIYGIHCCKNHCVYIDTDSIKSEGEG